MSDLQKLLDAGAYSCAGDLIFKGKAVGKLRNGVFVPNDDGEVLIQREAEVVDVVDKAVAKAVAKPKKTKAEPVPEPVPEPVEPEPELDLTADLDDLLN